jgi:C1A family cysteine protease
MFDIASFNQSVHETFLREMKVTTDAMKANMQANNQVASGDTIKSIREEFTGDTGVIWAYDHIDTLETGISPERSKAVSWIDLYSGLAKWYSTKHGYTAQGNKDRLISSTAFRQRTLGSVMWRNGITKNVYSQEVEPLVQRISDAIGQKVLDINILGQ